MPLTYHQATADLLGRPLAVSPAAVALLDARERALGITFPPSVREWYSLEGAVDILAHYSNQDSPAALGELGDDIEGELLVFMTENQGVCRWAVRLDTADDPRVLVSFAQPLPKPGWDAWDLHADRFSTFVYTHVWDWAGNDEDVWPCGLQAQDQPLAAADLVYLKDHLIEGPKTYTWPARVTYRFSNEHGRIVIWDDEKRQADWWLWARSPDDLTALARLVWDCGTLAAMLWEASDCGDHVLKRLRG